LLHDYRVKRVFFRLGMMLGWLVAFTAALNGAEYYLDPAGGDAANPGTRSAPWASLEAVAASSKVFATGDVLILLDGHHGSPVLRNANPGPVSVRPAAGARATLKSLTVQGRFWTVEGLEISPETAASQERTLLARVSGSDNILRGCLLYTVRDTSTWTAAEWDARSCDAIRINGTRQLVENNHLTNVRFGISVSSGAPHNIVRGNLIRNFSGDGIRGLGDYGVFEGNVVKNLYQVNKNHPDAFQSWSQTSAGVGKGVVKGVVVRGNYFLSYEDPKQPFRGHLQGIGCFDGFFEDWVVENNVILTSSWHGIAFYGARNCRIVNNTVADLNPSGKARPWIKITAHKNKQPSSGNLVRNNLACQVAVPRTTATVDHNLAEPESNRFFPNWAGGDLRLNAGSPAIDAGTNEAAPAFDLRGAPRAFPGNVAWDIGAYEFGAPQPDPDSPSMRPWEPLLKVPPMPQEAAPTRPAR
jgi:parallel beta-helix repeat protein